MAAASSGRSQTGVCFPPVCAAKDVMRSWAGTMLCCCGADCARPWLRVVLRKWLNVGAGSGDSNFSAEDEPDRQDYYPKSWKPVYTIWGTRRCSEPGSTIQVLRMVGQWSEPRRRSRPRTRGQGYSLDCDQLAAVHGLSSRCLTMVRNNPYNSSAGRLTAAA